MRSGSKAPTRQPRHSAPRRPAPTPSRRSSQPPRRSSAPPPRRRRPGRPRWLRRSTPPPSRRPPTQPRSARTPVSPPPSSPLARPLFQPRQAPLQLHRLDGAAPQVQYARYGQNLLGRDLALGHGAQRRSERGSDLLRLRRGAAALRQIEPHAPAAQHRQNAF